MSDGHIKVTFETISNAGQTVRTTAGTIDQQLSDLKAAVARVANSWTGAAKEGYDQRQAIWDQKASDLHSTLLQIATALDKAHESYTSTESANTSMWAG
ncbi:WXG100 family type VII secretion target [Kitasatospora acidiphila]|uniref:ESAT-6-like protein n=1 Tax=Kitasatospora acidiphila TaxID=2567942 RepID=A0A540W8L3_9ACTN|nr:WXG100 family type VII secretion target [Kitasatospora acidiphila]TQF05351.1 WXG100 family type VII secretion target [Kitasatospora acidiphila]